jgi:hypothetical protein
VALGQIRARLLQMWQVIVGTDGLRVLTADVGGGRGPDRLEEQVLDFEVRRLAVTYIITI